ncbi:MAG TPA: DUF3667 domain-containing protein [Candidatus Dormibacteraeota bacterium]|nr:DUF3667 domain-containing protein [Candidatus Dormibacteraeota bacterium]
MSTPEDAALIESAVAAMAPSAQAPAAPAAPAAAVPRCDNCGASVSGRYCGDCGQRLEPPVHKLSHFIKVAAEDVTHADSRLWRTLWALLFKPGYLTHEFLAGRRARYLPPVRLYLVLSVVFFVWFSATNQTMTVVKVEAPTSPASGAAPAPARHEYGPLAATEPGESPQQRAERVCPDLTPQGPWQDLILHRVTHACRLVVLDSGRSVRDAFLHNLPHAMFLFLPLLAALMMLMYWRPRHYYVEHLLLFVHNHAFGFLLLLIAAGVSALLPWAAPGIRFALCLYIPWYVYRSMRVVYGQGRWLTIAKLLPLSFFYLVSGILMLVLTVIYSGLSL